MFGAKKADIDSVLAMSMSEAVDRLLADTTAPNPPVVMKVDEYYKNPTTGVETYGAKVGETWTTRPYDGGYFESVRMQSMQSWWVAQMIDQEISIREKMVLFWHNHFVSEWTDVLDARMMYRQNDLFRRNVLANFKTLTRDVTLDPAMIRYLNGNTNTRASANENYARELQELFTIGKGPVIAPGNYTNYTEDDVKAAAKVLTGWTDVRDPLGISFTLSKHDTTDKQFSSAYGSTVVKGTNSGDAGARQELDDLLNMIFAQDETARYIVRKLYRYFVYYVIDSTTETNIIKPLAGMLRGNGYNIKPVLATLLKSSHFFDAWNMGCVIRNPIDHAVGTIRQCGIVMPDPATQLYQYANALYAVVSLGANGQMTLCAPPNVAGWPAFWQEPMFYEIWITSDTLPKRNQFTDALTGNGYTYRDSTSKNPVTVVFDPWKFLTFISDPSDVNIIIAEASQYLFPGSLSQDQIDSVGEAMMGTKNYYEWDTKLWPDYTAKPTDTALKNQVAAAIRNLVKTLMDMAEYQLS